jgi:hypothetical protein
MRNPTSTLLTADACRVILQCAGWTIYEMPIVRTDGTGCLLVGTNWSSLLAIEEPTRTKAWQRAFERVQSFGHISPQTVCDSMRWNWSD